MKPFKDIFNWADDPSAREVLIEIEGWYLYKVRNELHYSHGCDRNNGGEMWDKKWVYQGRNDVLMCGKCHKIMNTNTETIGILYRWGMNDN